MDFRVAGREDWVVRDAAPCDSSLALEGGPSVKKAGRLRAGVVIAGLLAAATVVVPSPVLAAAIGVNTAADENGTGTDCSLREAIQSANTDSPFGGCTAGSGPDVIDLPAGTYGLSNGELQISSDVTINGAGSASTNVKNGSACAFSPNRLFSLDPGSVGNVDVTFNSFTMSNGNSSNGGAIHLGDSVTDNLTVNGAVFEFNCSSSGGAIGQTTRSGNLTITNSIFSGNYSYSGNGGAINYVGGAGTTVTVTGSSFSGNTGAGTGGALNLVASDPLAVFHVDSSSFSQNGAGGSGGAIAVSGGTLLLGANAANAFFSNTDNTGFGALAASNGAVVSAERNWWRCNEGPTSSGCDRAMQLDTSTIDFDPWIVVTAHGPTNPLYLGASTTLSVDLTHDSNTDVIPATRYGALIGRPTTWRDPFNGSLSNADTAIRPDGSSQATFTATGLGIGHADADTDGYTQEPSFLIVEKPDTSAPVVTNVNVGLEEGGHIGSVSTRVSWFASDNTTPSTQLLYQVQRRTYISGAWGSWQTVATTTGTPAIDEAPLWARQEHRVRARDAAGNWSPWSVSWPISFVRRDEDQFTRSAGWQLISAPNAMQGGVARSTTPGATATLAFRGQNVAVVAPTGPGRGKLIACLDPGGPQEMCRSMYLSGPASTKKLVVAFAGTFWGDHVLTVKVVFGVVDLDGAIFSK
jgi:CSLREA domain-containing protein